MDEQGLVELAEKFLGAWNSQSVDEVLACYTKDLVYSDPNTRGSVLGAEAMERYLSKLFSAWQMHWTLREGFSLQDVEGAGVLWTARIQRKGGADVIEVDGMDLVLLEDGLISRNEVYFDRAALAPLLEPSEAV